MQQWARAGTSTSEQREQEVREMRRLWLGSLLSSALALFGSAVEGRAGFVSDTLGSAGPGNFAILTLNGSGDPHLNGPGQTTGNVGVSSGTLHLDGSAGPEVNGNVLLAPGANISISNPPQVTGSVLTNQNLSQANTDALNAAATFAGLAPTQSVPGGAVNGTTTINGGLGTNVVNLSSLNLGNNQTLTLNGPAGSQFVVNDSGGFTLNSGRINLTGGLTPSDVVFNLAGSSPDVHTSGGLGNESVINGILLAPNRSIGLSPGLINGELISGGPSIQLASGASVVQTPPGQVVPAPSSVVLMGLGGCVFAAFVLRSRRQPVAAAC
jgi:hypothetical protein